MPYIDDFNKIVTATKKNNRYYGPTESGKIASFLSEVQADLDTIYDEVNTVRSAISALASGYLEQSDVQGSLNELKRKTYNLQRTLDERLYVEAEQQQLF